METARYKRFVTRLLSLLGIILAVTLFVNVLVDPLWHFKGNRVGEISYRFEERSMKLNGIMNNPDAYDCLIFGASRATLLDEALLEEHRCYNMAFSLGHVREFVLIAEYLKSRGFTPDTVIVSVDEVSFQPRAFTDGERLPPYVKTLERPKLAIEDYLGVTTLRFSYETLFDPPSFIRGYERRDDGSFRGILIPHTRVYEPKAEAIITHEHLDEYDEEMVDEFYLLRDIYPDATFIGYVPPSSDWAQAKMDLTDNLERYIEYRYALVPLFTDGFWDFSVPSEITADTSLTFDGEHYEQSVNDQIGRCLNGALEECGADLTQLSLEQFRQLVLPSIRARIEREGLTVRLGRGDQTLWNDEI